MSFFSCRSQHLHCAVIAGLSLFPLASKVFADGTGIVLPVITTAASGPGSLASAISGANAAGNGATIQFSNNLGTFNIAQLPDIVVGVTLAGGTGNTLNGQNLNRIFFVNAPGQSVQITGLTLANGLAQGGNGGIGGGTGGGGAGLGGAVFINAGNVNFTSVAFTGNTAKGGKGADSFAGGGGGGGGMGFNGAAGSEAIGYLGLGFGPGGGGGARTSAGGAPSITTGGNGGGQHGAAGGNAGLTGTSATSPDGGGGGGGYDGSAYNGVTFAGSGGSGSDFGGGGGGASSAQNNAADGGGGGFGAGGGGGADAGQGFAGNGGNGGFGGGGGGAGGSPNTINYGPSFGGNGGFGGGAGGFSNEGTGGGGAGFGAAVFVRSANGASISFTNSSTDAGTITAGQGGNSGLPGHSGSPGSAAGGALFLMGGATNISISPNTTQTIAGSIAESSSSSIAVTGGGTLVLSGIDSTFGYSGGTTVTASTLSISADNNLGASTGSLTLSSASTLEITGFTGLTSSRATALGTGSETFSVDSAGNVFTLSGVISGAGGLTKSGNGSMVLNAIETYTGATTINAGTLVASHINGSFAGTTGITVNSGGLLKLANNANVNNALGTGGPGNTIPAITINTGGTVTSFAGTTHNLNVINFAGGTLSGGLTTPSPFYNFTFNSDINVDATAATSTISSPVGIGLRGTINFNVSAGSGQLTVQSLLADEPNTTGGLNKTGPGLMVLSKTPTYSGNTTVTSGTLELLDATLPATTCQIASGAILQNATTARDDENPITFTGTGTLRITGTGAEVFGANDDVNVNLSAGALIDVQSGALVASSDYGGIWTSNQASLNIASGATVDAVEAGPTGAMNIDALKGNGTFSGGYFANANGTSTLTIGVASGSGTFAGNISDDSSAHLTIVKTGAGTQTFTGTNTYTGGTSANAGNLVLGSPSAFPANTPLAITGGTVQVSNLIGSTKILLNASSLTFGGTTNNWTGKLDLTTNDAIVHNGSLSNLTNQFKQAYNSASWNGSAGITSSTAAADTRHLTTLGIVQGSNYPASSFDGQSVSSTDVLIKYTYYGDADLNGTLNGADYQQIDLGFNSHMSGWANGDFNYDGVINGSDFALIDNTFNQLTATGAGPLAIFTNASPAVVSVPEPTSLALLGLSISAMIGIRRRRSCAGSSCFVENFAIDERNQSSRFEK